MSADNKYLRTPEPNESYTLSDNQFVALLARPTQRVTTYGVDGNPLVNDMVDDATNRKFRVTLSADKTQYTIADLGLRQKPKSTPQQ